MGHLKRASARLTLPLAVVVSIHSIELQRVTAPQKPA